jgi:hypothetical protein
MARPRGLLETAWGLFQPFGLRGYAARIKTLYGTRSHFVEQSSILGRQPNKKGQA